MFWPLPLPLPLQGGEMKNVINTCPPLYRQLLGPQKPESSPTQVAKKRCNAIEAGSKYVRVHTFNPRDSNTVVTNYYQVEKSFRFTRTSIS
jgi:hypothetical protein